MNGSSGKENRPDSSESTRRAQSEGEAKEPAEDARVAGVIAARAQTGTTPRPSQGGKGRDARSVREDGGANARRGNSKAAEQDEEEDEESESEEEPSFWKNLVGEAYRSRRRRGDWTEAEDL